ncbi:MAG: AMP-binding protein, partial [Actinomycetota bacterium]|nr:AMP-binding protein [Actinomycetota bacterium]
VTTLHDSGLRRGDAIAVAAANSIDHLVLILACARGGFVVSGFDLKLAPARWGKLLAFTRARLALADPAWIGMLRSCVGSGGAGGIPVLPLHELTAASSATWAALETRWPDEGEHFQVVHTSGATVRLKASRVVHRCSVHSAMSYQRVLQLQPGERTAVLFHLGYISALHAHVLPTMLAGGCSVLLAAASPRSYLSRLAEHRVAWAYAVPAWWQAVLREPGLCAAVLPSLRLLGAGGAPFDVELEHGLRERLPGTELLNVYGLSETHSLATILRDDEFAARPGSVGRPLPCMEVSVRSPDGAELPIGAVGEVWLRGSLVTTGYDGIPEATAETIVNGWFRTGDIGRVDAENYLWILDRVQEMINRGGRPLLRAHLGSG